MKIFVLFCLLLFVLFGCSNGDDEIINELSHSSMSDTSFENNTENSPETEEDKTEEDKAEEDTMLLNGWAPEFKPSDFETSEEYEKAFLDEYVKQLKPKEFFETEKEYPSVILEIFDIIMEKETHELTKCDELLGIEVFGDENEFFVSYQYSTKESDEEYLNIRVRKIEDGKYGLLLGGGGAPAGHGLEETSLTLDDIK